MKPEGQGPVFFFDKNNQPPVSIVTTMRGALVTAECECEAGDGESDGGIVLCEEHLEALQQGCMLCVYLPSGRKLYLRYEPEHPPRTW